MRTQILFSLLLACFSLLGQDSLIIQQKDKVIIKPQRKKDFHVNDSIYQARVKQAKLDGMYIPFDLKDAFKELNQLMDEEALKTFMAFDDAEVDAKTHATLGAWLENKWSMSEGSRLSEYFRKMQVPHYDYMIGILIQSYHRHLHGKDIKLKDQVLFFRKLWNDKQKLKAKELIERADER